MGELRMKMLEQDGEWIKQYPKTFITIIILCFIYVIYKNR